MREVVGFKWKQSGRHSDGSPTIRGGGSWPTEMVAREERGFGLVGQ